MADSIVRLSVDDSSFNAKIKEAAKSFATFGKNVASAGVEAFGKFAKGVETAKVAFQGFNQVLKANALVLVSTLAIQAGQALGEMIGDWISGANDAEDAQRKLNEELERSIKLLREMDDDADFNTKAAKAMGASTSEILQLKMAEAIRRRNAADVALANMPTSAIGSDAYNKLKKESEKYTRLVSKMQDEIDLDILAKQYKTGEYAVRGGSGGGRTKSTREPNIDFGKALASSLKDTEALKAMPERMSLFAELSDEAKKQMLGLSEATRDWGGAMAQIGEQSVLQDIANQIDNDTDKILEMRQAWSLAAQAVSSVGNVLHGIDDPAAKIMSTIAFAIANVAAAAGQAVGAKDTTASGWAWIGAAAAITASMVSMIEAIHSSTGYAQGGIVGGNSFSGDNTLIRANAQEVVLTRAMAGNLASQLEGNGLNGYHLEAVVTGEDLRFALRNNARRRGYGETVTSRNY